MNSPKKRNVLLQIVALFAIEMGIMCGCEHAPQTQPPPPHPRPAVNDQQSVQEMLKTCLEIDPPDTSLVRASSVPVTGDLRPLWRVSGRVRNKCPNEFYDVEYLIHVYRKNAIVELDSTELIISGTIAANSTRGFEQTVHLRINEQNWDWFLYPIKGKIGPVVD